MRARGSFMHSRAMYRGKPRPGLHPFVEDPTFGPAVEYEEGEEDGNPEAGQESPGWEGQGE